MPVEGRGLGSVSTQEVAGDGRLGSLSTPLSVHKLQAALYVKAKASDGYRQQYPVQLALYPGLLTGTHSAPARHAGAASYLLGQHFPPRSRLQNKQDARQYASIVRRLAAGVRLPPLPDWKQWLDYFPKFIINQFACHIASPR